MWRWNGSISGACIIFTVGSDFAKCNLILTLSKISSAGKAFCACQGALCQVSIDTPDRSTFIYAALYSLI